MPWVQAEQLNATDLKTGEDFKHYIHVYGWVIPHTRDLSLSKTIIPVWRSSIVSSGTINTGTCPLVQTSRKQRILHYTQQSDDKGKTRYEINSKQSISSYIVCYKCNLKFGTNGWMKSSEVCKTLILWCPWNKPRLTAIFFIYLFINKTLDSCYFWTSQLCSDLQLSEGLNFYLCCQDNVFLAVFNVLNYGQMLLCLHNTDKNKYLNASETSFSPFTHCVASPQCVANFLTSSRSTVAQTGQIRPAPNVSQCVDYEGLLTLHACLWLWLQMVFLRQKSINQIGLMSHLVCVNGRWQSLNLENTYCTKGLGWFDSLFVWGFKEICIWKEIHLIWCNSLRWCRKARFKQVDYNHRK